MKKILLYSLGLVITLSVFAQVYPLRIDIGTYPGDPNAKDSIYTGFDKVNKNFTWLYGKIASNGPIYFISNYIATNINITYTNTGSNYYGTNILYTNSIVTNLYVTNLSILYSVTTNSYITNINSYSTNIFTNTYTNIYITTNRYTTNINYNTNYYTTTNNYTTNIFNTTNFVTNIINTNIYTTNFSYTNNYITTNHYVTNIFQTTNIFNITTNTFSTNYYQTNFYYTTNNYITNYFTTNFFTTNIITTNYYTNTFIWTNSYSTNIYTNTYITTNSVYVSGISNHLALYSDTNVLGASDITEIPLLVTIPKTLTIQSNTISEYQLYAQRDLVADGLSSLRGGLIVSGDNSSNLVTIILPATSDINGIYIYGSTGQARIYLGYGQTTNGWIGSSGGSNDDISISANRNLIFNSEGTNSQRPIQFMISNILYGCFAYNGYFGIGTNFIISPHPTNNLDVRGNADITSNLWVGLDVYLGTNSLRYHLTNYNNPHLTTFSNLTDSGISLPVVGQVITWNGSKWYNSYVSTNYITNFLPWATNIQNLINSKLYATNRSIGTTGSLYAGPGLYMDHTAFNGSDNTYIYFDTNILTNASIINGDTNYISKFGPTSHSITNSQLYDNGTNILVGFVGTQPIIGSTVKLYINGSVVLTNGYLYRSIDINGSSIGLLGITSSNTVRIGPAGASNDVYIYCGPTNPLIRINSNTKFIGFNELEPLYTLDVNGSTLVRTNLYVGGSIYQNTNLVWDTNSLQFGAAHTNIMRGDFLPSGSTNGQFPSWTNGIGWTLHEPGGTPGSGWIIGDGTVDTIPIFTGMYEIHDSPLKLSGTLYSDGVALGVEAAGIAIGQNALYVNDSLAGGAKVFYVDRADYPTNTTVYTSGKFAGNYSTFEYYGGPEYVGITTNAYGFEIRNGIITLVTNSGSSSSLAGLTDVSMQPYTNGQVLKYNGSYWINVGLTTNDIPGLITLINTKQSIYNYAGVSTDGILSAANWNLFNAKQSALGSGTAGQYLQWDKNWGAVNYGYISGRPNGAANHIVLFDGAYGMTDSGLSISSSSVTFAGYTLKSMGGIDLGNAGGVYNSLYFIGNYMTLNSTVTASGYNISGGPTGKTLHLQVTTPTGNSTLWFTGGILTDITTP